MPFYTYVCKDCGYDFDMFLNVKDRNQPEEDACPECGKRNTIHKQISEVSRPVVHWDNEGK